MRYKTGLLCGRFQPLHNGHVELIKKALCECITLIIAIGSAQKEINERNPYTYNQREHMLLNIFKTGQLEVIPIKDINNPPKWAQYVIDEVIKRYTLKNIDIYFAGSQEDASFFIEKGIKTVLLDRASSSWMSGTEIRESIKLQREDWKKHVPEENWSLVVPLIQKNPWIFYDNL